MAIVIKKRVSLDFLGEEYKDAYLIFRSIPIKDFEALQNEIQGIDQDNAKSISFIFNKLKEYFISGEFPDESGKLQPVTSDDLDELDQVTTVRCFQALSGQEIDPTTQEVGIPTDLKDE